MSSGTPADWETNYLAFLFDTSQSGLRNDKWEMANEKW
jgi:hypothetical protein